ncbi:hypothetical protein F4820DRAFT_143955 [Hypoxylon rubiginosum]|uniref:Uncharacterized protein n=1 Tax=Hypoxylon rubiginosum TaxID=110542 RepID=A0ACB9ZIQ9_9PEZI|nr:hypothetical protein F4820DRAFT_143955 [Hypoxylon rubiginosum]
MATIAVGSTILGPLTATWTPPPACSIVVAACSTCASGWAAQACPTGASVTDNQSCWPPRTAGAYTPPAQQALLGWGIYTPASICPHGYSPACSYDGAAGTGNFKFQFPPRRTESVIGCCPTGYTCAHDVYSVQTCSMMLTSSADTIPTVTCESGTSADLGYITVPLVITTGVEFATTINTFTALAPLFQLVHQISTSPSDTSSPTSSAASAPPRQSVSSSQPVSSSRPVSSPQASSTSSSQIQGLSPGASAGIGCGVGLGVILLGAVAFCVFRSRRRKAESSETKTTELPAYTRVADTKTAELHAYTPAVEMRTDRDPVELETYHGGMQRPYYTQTPRYGFQVRH